MNPLEYIQLNYVQSNTYNNETKGGLSTSNDKPKQTVCQPQMVETHITEKGILSIKDKRYFRLGKFSLFNPIKNKSITNKEYMGILDTQTGQILCFDIDVVYNEYIQKDIKHVHVNEDKRFAISEQSKNIVLNAIYDKQGKMHDDFK